MAGIAALIVKVLPDSPEADLKKIKSSIEQHLKKEGAMNLSFEEVPIAFGLKAIRVKFAWPEEKSTDIVETTLGKIKYVSSVQIEDYRRAFG